MAENVVMNETIEEEEETEQLDENSACIDDNVAENMSPRSSSSSGRPFHVDLSVDGDEFVHASFDQLCENICDLRSSSSDQEFLLRQSFGSYGEEYLIDSELQQLVGGEAKEIEAIEEEEDVNDDVGVDVSSFNKENNKSGNPDMETLQGVESNQRKEMKHRNKERSSSEKQGTKNRNRANAKKGKAPNMGNGRKALSESELRILELGKSLLEQAKELMIYSCDNYNPEKALELSLRAGKLFETYANGKPDLDLVMCLHITASIYESTGRYGEAITVLERSIEIPVIEEGEKHALAKFAGLMQLGDTYAKVGQFENSILSYTKGLEIQKTVLGENDARVGETCRYVAEAHVQGLQFDKAEDLCKTAIEIHRENNNDLFPDSLEEAASLSLMGIICEKKGDHEAALENLVLANKTIAGNGQEIEVAFTNRSIGDACLSLSQYDEAFSAYEKSLKGFKTIKGENHPVVGSIYARLADLSNRMGKVSQARSYFQNALEIYENPIPESPLEEIASGFTILSSIHESMNELQPAIALLHKALDIYNNDPCHHNKIAGIEAQIGLMCYMVENYSESYKFLKNVVSKLQGIKKNKAGLLGMALNQMGLVCLHLDAINEAAELFREARSVMEQEYGAYHANTLRVCSNLAAAYDAMGRSDEAIEMLEYVVAIREEKLGTANDSDVEEEKRRLGELLKETDRVRSRQAKSLETLLDANSKAGN